MGFHEVPDVSINQSVPTEANRSLTSYKSNRGPSLIAGVRYQGLALPAINLAEEFAAELL
jgi:hypothetical protein